MITATIDIAPKIQDESRQGEAYTSTLAKNSNGKFFYIESYGCQMNFSDSEIVASILQKEGFNSTSDYNIADLILINTCSIRENAEQKVRDRLRQFNGIKKRKPDCMIGVLGCMAERLKSKFLEEEKLVDIVVGPDAYRDLPNLIKVAEDGQKAINVLLSIEETYSDISPVRLGTNGVSAYISIMRGCDNMCSFCVVPFTRGRERSRDAHSIIAEAKQLFEEGYREVTLLGQNVDSYKYEMRNEKLEIKEVISFARLLEMVALINPLLRVRFSTSHPKDITDEVLHTIAKYENICNSIHLPVQSGSSRILKMMNRTYNREWYLERVNAIKKIIPDCGISTDVISGFCSETEEEHQETLSIMQEVKFDFAYMYKYSERPGTLAERQYKDDILEEIKLRRLQEIIDLQRKLSHESNLKDIGKTYKVLVEGISKRDENMLCGRNDQNKVVIFPKENFKKGDYVNVLVEECTSGTLIGKTIH